MLCVCVGGWQGGGCTNAEVKVGVSFLGMIQIFCSALMPFNTYMNLRFSKVKTSVDSSYILAIEVLLTWPTVFVCVPQNHTGLLLLCVSSVGLGGRDTAH